MVGVDVGHHRGHGLQMKKGGVGFVGLDDDEFARPEAGVGSGAHQPSADHESGVEPAFGEHAGDEARGGGLAVGAGNRDPLLQAHELGEHQRTRHDRNAS